ncbi:Polysulfide reductase, NrfD [Rosistilla oblonga]|uniref:Polysulfide reductase, NrfD n=2 Tax=Rosistilla TaxID=2795779 RepID=A0A518IWT4_9BACT|nr:MULTISPECIES: NrfD/PsrC family molybdoenzyme membrane anchor subunit [Rosistilla]QDS90181.1 Polysulfide reductase, NrfD [Rosistilla ulvae]QDV14315.1 Polysulfide reductase, NrfD [Rosistilla oblonga]QDV57552.1 Polysulfide reductase, NrfD [Rosistilla oblonga]
MAIAVPNKLDNTLEQPDQRAPLVLGDSTTYHTITESVSTIAERMPSKAWIVAFLISSHVAAFFGLLIAYLLYTGVGVWGNRSPVFWGWPIVNFVFWVGIGHAGTLISAILFLFRQDWRTSINRAAEAMTIFAVVCAGTFPGIHVGRAWLAYWLFPYPSLNLWMWPQFRSPLLWDVFAVSTYATVSLLFWYMGMVPDLATFRDRSKNKFRRFVYGVLSLGWSGSARHWHRYEKAYALLAALAAPLVLSVHTIVSFDFAVSQVPGWHTTIFPPYFVAGAVFSGFAMVVTLLVPCRSMFKLENLITIRHLENMNKIILATGSIVGLAYGTEFFIAWYGQVPAEKFAFINRAFGPYWWAYWIMVTCNVISPQLFWFRFFRTNLVAMVIVCIFVNIGMWFERFVIVVSSLSRDYLPSAWGYFSPTWVDIGMLIGSFGLFFTLFLLFCRFLPIIAMSEVKAVLAHQLHVKHAHHDDKH